MGTEYCSVVTGFRAVGGCMGELELKWIMNEFTAHMQLNILSFHR